MPEQSKLEQIGIEQRNNLIANKIYNSETGNQYNSTHTRAISDTETPIYGKGTGEYMDTQNGGGSYDINGTPDNMQSGRLANLASNDYNPSETYQAPDTSGNVGQVHF